MLWANVHQFITWFLYAVYFHSSYATVLCDHRTPRPLARVPLGAPRPRPMLDPLRALPLALVLLLRVRPLKVVVLPAPVDVLPMRLPRVDVPYVVRPTPRVPRRVPPRKPRPVDESPLDVDDDADGAANRRRSSSSALRFASSRFRCASAARRSASCWRCRASASMAWRSCVAPCHCGSRSRRWLCSVCDSRRVQVLSSADALPTVCATVCWSVRGARRRNARLCTYPHVSPRLL
jgi:hypothetical protein